MTTLSQSVQDAIQAGLPGMVAGELKTFISNAERTAKDLESSRNTITAQERDIANYRREVEKHDALDVRQRDLDKQLAEINAKELALIRSEAALEGAIAKAELSGVKDTMAHFLRNTTVRETVSSSIMKPVDGVAPGQSSNGYNNPGCPGTLQQAHDFVTTTKEIT